MLDHSFTPQAIMEQQKLLAEIGAKTDRLISDVEAHGTKIDAVRHQVTFVKGAFWVLALIVAGMGTAATADLRLQPTAPAPIQAPAKP